MTEDDIMLMAQKAGPLTKGPFKEWCKRFAALVAAHKAEVITAEAYRCGVEAGAAAEREACAKVCDEYDVADDVNTCDTAEGIALAIRMRRD